MIESDDKRFKEILTSCAAFYEKIISAELTSTFHEILKSYDIQEIDRAFILHIKSSEFFPKVANIIRYIEGTNQGRALKAWSKVNKWIRSVGPYDSVVFDDPAIHCVIRDMGGWDGICAPTQAKMPFIENDFKKRYENIVQMNDFHDHPKKIIGISESENNSRGLEVKPPVVIGDLDEARKVYLSGHSESKMIRRIASDFLNQENKRINK